MFISIFRGLGAVTMQKACMVDEELAELLKLERLIKIKEIMQVF